MFDRMQRERVFLDRASSSYSLNELASLPKAYRYARVISAEIGQISSEKIGKIPGKDPLFALVYMMCNTLVPPSITPLPG
jgi:hypothetical protein